MPTTANGLVYPGSGEHNRLWEHFQNLAESADTLYAGLPNVAFRHAHLTRSTTQSIANNATDYISWTVETQDTHGFIAVPGTTVTIPAGSGGVYSLSAFARFSHHATGFCVLFLEINGVQGPEWRNNTHSTGTQPTSMAISLAAHRLAAGDTVKVGVFQNSGVARTIDSVNPPRLQLLRHAA
jgi:hypothetical protein